MRLILYWHCSFAADAHIFDRLNHFNSNGYSFRNIEKKNARTNQYDDRLIARSTFPILDYTSDELRTLTYVTYAIGH